MKDIDPAGVHLYIGNMKIESFLPDMPSKDSSYVYRDEDGAIHLVESSTGFHAVMSNEFYESLLKWKEPKPFDEQVKDALARFILEELNNSKRPNKPWYRKERW